MAAVPPDFTHIDALLQEYLVYRGFTEVFCMCCCGRCGNHARTTRWLCWHQTLACFRKENEGDRLARYNVDAFIDQIRALLNKCACFCATVGKQIRDLTGVS